MASRDKANIVLDALEYLRDLEPNYDDGGAGKELAIKALSVLPARQKKNNDADPSCQTCDGTGSDWIAGTQVPCECILGKWRKEAAHDPE